MEDALSLIGDLGAPIAVGIGAGVFIFVIMKQIFDGLVDDIGTLKIFASSLTTRVKTMNNDMIKLDILVSHALNVKPDEERIARADGKDDARKD
jgi:hypothetical protein